MRSWIGLGLLVFAALMGLFFLMTGAEPFVYRVPVTEGASEPAALTSDADRADPAREELAPMSEETAEVATDTPDDPERMWGRVIDGITRAPIARAEVELLHRDADEFWSLDLEAGERIDELAHTITDADGSFAFAVARGRLHRLTAHAAGYADRTVLGRIGGAEVTIEMVAGATVEGIVREANGGDPVAGVEVRVAVRGESLPLGETTTGPDGMFHLAGLQPAEVYVQFNPIEHPVLWKRAQLEGGQVHRLEVELEPGRTLRGRVLDAVTRQGIAEAELSDSWTFGRSTRSGADGSFVLKGLDQDLTAELYVRARGYTNASPKLPADADEEVEILLTRGGSVTGRIVDRDGTPPENVYAAVGASFKLRPGFWHTDWIRAWTSVTGEFAIEGLRPDLHYWLYVRARGFGTRMYALPRRTQYGEPLDVGTIVLQPAARIEGRLVYDDGSPVPNQEVRISGHNSGALDWLEAEQPTMVSQFRDRSTTTASDGTFRATDLSGGHYNLSCLGTDFNVSIADGELRTGIKLEVKLGLEIAGKVARSDGHPLSEPALLHLVCPSSESKGAVTGSDGRFEIKRLEPGVHTLQVLRCEPGWIAPLQQDVTAGASDITVLLQPAAKLSGRVVGADGEPLSASVFVTFDTSVPGAAMPSTVSKNDGTFTLDVPSDFFGSIHAQENPAIKATIDGVTAGQADLVLRLQVHEMFRKR